MTNPYERERWLAIRKRGLVRYILIRGVLVWGLSMGVVWVAAHAMYEHGVAWESLRWARVSSRIMAALVVFPITGALWALVQWAAKNKRYREG